MQLERGRGDRLGERAAYRKPSGRSCERTIQRWYSSAQCAVFGIRIASR